MAQCHTLGVHIFNCMNYVGFEFPPRTELPSHSHFHRGNSFHKGPQCLDEISKGYRSTSRGKGSDSPVEYQLPLQKRGDSHKGSVAPCCDDTAQPLPQDLRCVGQTALMSVRLWGTEGPQCLR